MEHPFLVIDSLNRRPRTWTARDTGCALRVQEGRLSVSPEHHGVDEAQSVEPSLQAPTVGLIVIEKAFEARQPVTYVRLTPEGREALKEHLRRLDALRAAGKKLKPRLA